MRLLILLVGLVYCQEEVAVVTPEDALVQDPPAEVVPALPIDLQRALYEEEIARRIGGGGGLQLGPVGLGLGGGFTPNGFKFGAGAGLGNYGQYTTYYTPSTYASYAPWSYFKRPVTTAPASRHLGGGVGLQFGPVGFGGAVGLGAGGLNVKAGAGFNNQYQYYGTPQYYSQLYQN